MTLTPMSSIESARKNFWWTRPTPCLESCNQTFLGSGSRNDSNTHQLARIGQNKIFHELDVYDVKKEGIERFWAHEAEMNLTPISSLESARKKFFMNSTYIMSRKKESNAFGLRRPKWLKHRSVRSNRQEKNFSWTRRTSCLESGNQTFFGSWGRNDSNTDQFARIGEKKIFHELDVHHV